ncbi:MAG: efflux RND transporter periplasmic adaptor subunit [bacterium]|nr:efflux RND transporter periplasmic adaptor subunit [bacterium]
MKNTIKICFLILSILFITSCNNNTVMDSNNNDGTYYTCSMDPQVKQDKPGKCPICHMDLIKIKPVDSKINEITLSEQQIKLGNIKTASIEASQYQMDQKFLGVLTNNQNNVNVLSTRAMGRIEKLYVKTDGDYVKVGQPIYEIYSEDISIAKQDYKTAFLQLELTDGLDKNISNLLEAAKQKLLYFGLTNAQIEALQTTKVLSPYTTFYSNYTGFVSEVLMQEGSYAMEGSPLLKLVDLSSLWLEVQVNANYISDISIGKMAIVSFDDFPEKSLNAKVSFINSEVIPTSRLVLVRLDIPNPNLTFKPGMQANVSLVMGSLKGLFVPIDAVIQDEKSSYIWIEKSDGKFENKMVETGEEVNGLIEIKSNINPNTKIVISGAYLINSEFIFRTGSDPMEGMKM